jgi:MFS family permease
VAICAFFILPNFPRTTSWLTPEERELAIWRLEEDAGEADEDKRSVFWGCKLALKDIRVYILMLMITCIVSSGGVTNFFPTVTPFHKAILTQVVQTLNKSNVETLFLTVPPYVLAVITTFLNSLHADRTGERFFHVVIPLCFGLLAYIIAASTTSFAPRYFAMMLMPAGCYTGYVICLAWISNTLPRPPAKRAAALALINAVSNATSIYVSYMYQDKDAPRFLPAMIVNAVTLLVAMGCALVLRILLVRLNGRLERGGEVDGISRDEAGVENVDGGGGSVTQVKHGFRYLV